MLPSLLVLALLLGAQPRPSQAQEAVSAPPAEEGDPRTLLGLAVAAQQAGDLERAVSLYERVLAAVGDEPRILSNLGAAYSRLGRYPEAVGSYERALAIAPSEAAIRQNLALALYKTGELRKAAAEAARIVEAHPENEAATLLLAECHLQLASTTRSSGGCAGRTAFPPRAAPLPRTRCRLRSGARDGRPPPGRERDPLPQHRERGDGEADRKTATETTSGSPSPDQRGRTARYRRRNADASGRSNVLIVSTPRRRQQAR